MSQPVQEAIEKASWQEIERRLGEALLRTFGVLKTDSEGRTYRTGANMVASYGDSVVYSDETGKMFSVSYGFGVSAQ